MVGSGHPVPTAALWRWWNGAVGFLFQLACTEVNLTWLNTVMSHTKLLWPVLTQRHVCTAPCWLGCHISNKSDIHSLTTVTLTLHSWYVAQRFPRQTLPAATWNPRHNVACVVSLAKHLRRLLGCHSFHAVRPDQQCLRATNDWYFPALAKQFVWFFLVFECTHCTYSSNCNAFCSSANSGYENEVLLLHAADAHEWATYLQQLLKSSRKFSKRSVLLYTLSLDDHLHGYNYECFQCCSCIVLLVTGELLDILGDQELHEALQRLLSPPCRVVALLCGVTEDDEVKVNFEDWPWWRKISAEDEAHVYVSTILETIANSMQNLLHLYVYFDCFKGKSHI